MLELHEWGEKRSLLPRSVQPSGRGTQMSASGIINAVIVQGMGWRGEGGKEKSSVQLEESLSKGGRRSQ